MSYVLVLFSSFSYITESARLILQTYEVLALVNACTNTLHGYFHG